MKQLFLIFCLVGSYSYASEYSLICHKQLTIQERTDLHNQLKKYERKAFLHQGVGHYFKGAAIFTLWAMDRTPSEFNFLVWFMAMPSCLKISADAYAIAQEYKEASKEIKNKLNQP